MADAKAGSGGPGGGLRSSRCARPRVHLSTDARWRPGLTAEAGIEAVRGADRDFFRALLDRDITALEMALAEEFMIVDVASGSVHARVAFLEAISSGMVTFQAIETFPEETVIRFAGPGTAVVIGRTAMSLGDAEGGLTELASRYTHVFLLDGQTWRLASAQGTPISR